MQIGWRDVFALLRRVGWEDRLAKVVSSADPAPRRPRRRVWSESGCR